MHKMFAQENIRRWRLDDAERTVFDIYSQVWTVLMILTQTCSLARLRLCFLSMSYTETSLDVIRLSRVDKNPPVKRLKLISVGSKDAAVWALTGSSCLSLGVVVCLWASAALFPVTLENISDPLSSATFLSRVLWARAALATLARVMDN